MANILVVEDNPDLAHVLTQLIEVIGHHAYSVQNGEDGIIYLEELGYAPDAILCDLHLPGGMDGLSFLRMVRRRREWERVFFVAMSGKPDDQPHALASGANDYLAKPFDLQALQNILKGRLS